MTDHRVFLVVEPMAPIAEDLADCITECHPEAQVLRAADAAAAIPILAGLTRVSVAFVHLDPQGFPGSCLGMALADRGATVIFMGSRADMAPEGTLLRLQGPFDCDSVQMLLDSISRRSEQSQAPGMTPEA
jgi:hypothetical protein